VKISSLILAACLAASPARAACHLEFGRDVCTSAKREAAFWACFDNAPYDPELTAKINKCGKERPVTHECLVDMQTFYNTPNLCLLKLRNPKVQFPKQE
jgi:hypothetical protein